MLKKIINLVLESYYVPWHHTMVSNLDELERIYEQPTILISPNNSAHKLNILLQLVPLRWNAYLDHMEEHTFKLFGGWRPTVWAGEKLNRQFIHESQPALYKLNEVILQQLRKSTFALSFVKSFVSDLLQLDL